MAQTMDPLTLGERPRAISPLEEPGASPEALSPSIRPFGFEQAAQPTARASGRIDDSLPWGLSNSQTLRLCFNGEPVRALGDRDVVIILVRITEVAELSEVNERRTVAVETEVRIPANETECAGNVVL